MDCRGNVVLGGKKRFEQILIVLTPDKLNSYLRLIQPSVALSQISHLIL